jgi:hypothetical protein
VHGLLEAERAAIVELFQAWAGIVRSHSKLAAHGSRLELVHASASTVHRVLASEGLVLQGPPAREPQVQSAIVGTFSMTIGCLVIRSIALSIRCSRGSARVTATPSRPARPTLPIRWM